MCVIVKSFYWCTFFSRLTTHATTSFHIPFKKLSFKLGSKLFLSIDRVFTTHPSASWRDIRYQEDILFMAPFDR